MRTVGLFILSWGVCAWGQPYLSNWLTYVSSSVGFAMFWMSLWPLRSKKKRYWLSTLWFFCVQAVQLYWLATPEYQGLYIYFLYVGVSCVLALQFGLIALCLPYGKAITIRRILGIASFWTLVEWSRLFFYCGFPFNPLGLSLTGSVFASQLASVFGVFGLTYLVIVINLSAVNAWYFPSKVYTIRYLCVLFFPYLFGALNVFFHTRSMEDSRYYVVLVQTSLLPDEKDLFHHQIHKYVHPYLQWQSIVSYLQCYEESPIDLIVLPEYAVPGNADSLIYLYKEACMLLGDSFGDLSRLLIEPFAEFHDGQWYVSNAFFSQAIAEHYSAELIIGLDTTRDNRQYNTAMYFSPVSYSKSNFYAKRVLLPFVEASPGLLLSALSAQYGITHFFDKGEEPKVFGARYQLGLSICFEECYPYLMRQSRAKGAQLLVNITNDGWFPFSNLPEVHYAHGRIRAIENGAPLLRACNTGVTAVVDSLGRTVAELKDNDGSFQHIRGSIYVPVNVHCYRTLYTFWGDIAIIGLSIGMGLFSRESS